VNANSRGRVWKLGADIDTDLLAPGRWMKLPLEALAAHCLEAVRPEFAQQVRAGEVVVAGANFGVGSSREQAAAGLKHPGIGAVLAPSFAGIYFRNAINLGLPALACAPAEIFTDGEHIDLNVRTGRVTRADGSQIACEPLPAFLGQIAAAGGLLPSLRQRFAAERVGVDKA
jgi:3-isopropylmalate/(R)-2-methylmalate dehydratase small subunit